MVRGHETHFPHAMAGLSQAFLSRKKPYHQDAKNETTKIVVKKEIVQKLRDDIETKKGLPKQIKASSPTSSKDIPRTLSLTGGVAAPIPSKNNRVLLKWCCSDFSFFGMPSVDSIGCTVTRLTMREDMITDYGYKYAQSAVNNAPRDNTVFLWSAIPCKGGSPWHNLNKKLPGGMERIQALWALFRKRWKKRICFVDWLNQTGRNLIICIEWPKGCAY